MKEIFRLKGPEWVQSEQKRKFDRLLCILLALPVGSVALSAAGLIRIIDGVNPIYRQDRYGDFEEPHFSALKLCTMPGITQITPSEGRHDSRASRLGNVLRASHTDEFPQLINVWRRQMSFVGPRAWPKIIQPEVKRVLTETEYDDLMWARRITRPGIVDPFTAYSYRRADDSDRREQGLGQIQYARTATLEFDLKALLAAGFVSLEGIVGIEHPKLMELE